jgi:hypothetical protein
MSFWLGAALGLFSGTLMGVLLTCILVASRKQLPEPEAASLKVVRWDVVNQPTRAPGRSG